MPSSNEDDLIRDALISLLSARTTLPPTPLGDKIKLAISGVFYEAVPGYMIPEEVRPDFRHFNAGLVASLLEAE